MLVKYLQMRNALQVTGLVLFVSTSENYSYFFKIYKKKKITFQSNGFGCGWRGRSAGGRPGPGKRLCHPWAAAAAHVVAGQADARDCRTYISRYRVQDRHAAAAYIIIRQVAPQRQTKYQCFGLIIKWWYRKNEFVLLKFYTKWIWWKYWVQQV